MVTDSAREADRSGRNASFALGLSLPTDTVLYLLLPLYAGSFGVTLAEAGVLLAANRLVRIMGNAWVARFYEKNGARTAAVLAVAGSVISSVVYATTQGIWPLLIARLIWGLSFSAFNITVQSTTTAVSEGSARRNGISRAIISTFPALSLPIGALLAEWIGAQAVFLALAGMAALSLPFALQLPSGKAQPVRSRPRFGLPHPLDTWSFIQGLTLDGLFVMGLAILAQAALPEGAGLAAGTALAVRYVAEILLGPPSGHLAERFGALPLLLLCSTVSAIGLLAMGAGFFWSAALAVVILRGFLQPLGPPVVAAWNPGAERVPALARFATWRDLGAGLGPMIAGVLLPILPPLVLYGGAAVLLLAATWALKVHK